MAFACPLSHLIKLLNVSCLIRSILNSCHLVYTRYRPEILYNDLQCASGVTNIQYSKLNQNASKSSSRHHQISLKERLKTLFGKTPQYIHKLSSPKGPAGAIRKAPHGKKPTGNLTAVKCHLSNVIIVLGFRRGRMSALRRVQQQIPQRRHTRREQFGERRKRNGDNVVQRRGKFG